MDILIKTLIDVIRVDNPSTLSQNDIDNLQHLAGPNGDMRTLCTGIYSGAIIGQYTLNEFFGFITNPSDTTSLNYLLSEFSNHISANQQAFKAIQKLQDDINNIRKQ
ncbi:hypothetical protein FACS189496_1740 [Bacilli bacterium]|nr:hypothetical protein FACS189496_1740 [Bacilli bacterium]